MELEEPRYEGRDRMERFSAARRGMKTAQCDVDGDGDGDGAGTAAEIFPRVVFVVAENGPTAER